MFFDACSPTIYPWLPQTSQVLSLVGSFFFWFLPISLLCLTLIWKMVKIPVINSQKTPCSSSPIKMLTNNYRNQEPHCPTPYFRVNFSYSFGWFQSRLSERNRYVMLLQYENIPITDQSRRMKTSLPGCMVGLLTFPKIVEDLFFYKQEILGNHFQEHIQIFFLNHKWKFLALLMDLVQFYMYKNRKKGF